MKLLLCRKDTYYTFIDCKKLSWLWRYSNRWQQEEVGGPAVGLAADLVDGFTPAAVTDFSTQVGEAKAVVSCDASTQTDQSESNHGRQDLIQINLKKFKDVSVQTVETNTYVSTEESSTASMKIVPTEEIKDQIDAVVVPSLDIVTEPVTECKEVTVVAKPKKSTLAATLKYWKRRYSLFSRFDQGVVLDEVSFYSVCPEILASHMARRCTFDIVVDPFCGAGGNVIQLALTCRRVIAVDVDPEKIKLARRNAQIYGVEKKIDFRVGNCFEVLDGIRADAVVTSPPWGGPGYSRRFDPNDLCSREMGGMTGILEMARSIAPRVVLHVPKTIDRKQCLEQSRNQNFGRVEFEDVTIDGRLNCVNLYLKSRQGGRQLGPAISSKVELESGCRNGTFRSNGIAAYSSYLDKVAEFLNIK